MRRPPFGKRRVVVLELEEVFAIASVIGILAAQLQEPDTEHTCEMALDMGEKLAAGARKRRAKREAAGSMPD